MIDKNLLDMLVCPTDQTPLSLAEQSVIDKLNLAIAAGEIRNVGGRAVVEPIDAGLIRQDKTLLYPIVDDIPVMLAEEGIPLPPQST